MRECLTDASHSLGHEGRRSTSPEHLTKLTKWKKRQICQKIELSSKFRGLLVRGSDFFFCCWWNLFWQQKKKWKYLQKDQDWLKSSSSHLIRFLPFPSIFLYSFLLIFYSLLTIFLLVVLLLFTPAFITLPMLATSLDDRSVPIPSLRTLSLLLPISSASSFPIILWFFSHPFSSCLSDKCWKWPNSGGWWGRGLSDLIAFPLPPPSYY